jgi:hypothetical protein
MCVGLRLRTPFCVVLLLGLWWILAELSLLSHKSASAAAPTPASPSLAAAPRLAARANAASLETAREKLRALLARQPGWWCGRAPWSLNWQRDGCDSRRGLRCFNGYAVLSRSPASWNAFPSMRTILRQAGYEDCLQPEQRRAEWHSAPFAGLRDDPELLLVPNYWRAGAPDWRQFRLLPSQRISRHWGMSTISQKRNLMQTLNDHYGVARCPFLPASYSWQALKALPDWRERVGANSHWLLKRNKHRGQVSALVGRSLAPLPDPSLGSAQGLRMATSDELLNGSVVPGPEETVQQYLDRPMLVNGHKFSLRLYSLITCANPLRVYLYACLPALAMLGARGAEV